MQTELISKITSAKKDQALHLATYLFRMCYIEYLDDKLLVWWLISCRQSFCKVVWKYNFINIILLQEFLYQTFKIRVMETKKSNIDKNRIIGL